MRKKELHSLFDNIKKEENKENVIPKNDEFFEKLDKIMTKQKKGEHY